jgi:hypothetical protein
VLAALFAATVWPTRYRYDQVTVNGNTYPMRTSRFTGESYTFRGDNRGWVSAKSNQKKEIDPDNIVSLPKKAVDGLSGGGEITGDGSLDLDVLNKTQSWRVTKIKVRVKVYEREDVDDYRIDHIYTLTPEFYDFVGPGKSRTFTTYLGWSLMPAESWIPKIVSAQGVKVE